MTADDGEGSEADADAEAEAEAGAEAEEAAADHDADDPFEQLSPPADREGDPFESLASEDATETSTAEPRQTPASGSDDGDSGGAGGPGGAGGLGAEEADRRDSTTVADVDSAAEREGDPFASAESAFQSMDLGEIDPDAVWEDLVGARNRGSVAEVDGTTYAEVSKHTHCETCEYFSAPREIACSHEGTEILAFTDMETVRVADCPVVAERRALGEEE